MNAQILQPVVALAVWTMVMWVWMYATRIPAMGAAKIEADSLVQQGAKSLDELLPAQRPVEGAELQSPARSADGVLRRGACAGAAGGWATA
jgi:hypothetical protein